MAVTDIPNPDSDTIKLLKQMKQELERSFFDPGTPARDKASLSRQLLVVQAQLSAAVGDAEDRKLDAALDTIADAGTADFDPSEV